MNVSRSVRPMVQGPGPSLEIRASSVRASFTQTSWTRLRLQTFFRLGYILRRSADGTTNRSLSKIAEVVGYPMQPNNWLGRQAFERSARDYIIGFSIASRLNGTGGVVIEVSIRII